MIQQREQPSLAAIIRNNPFLYDLLVSDTDVGNVGQPLFSVTSVH